MFLFRRVILTILSFSSAFFPLQGYAHAESTRVETDHFSDILRYIKPNSLILLDIDDTLMEPKQTLGSDAWFRWRIKFYEKRGMDANLALETALMDWEAIQCLTEVQLVEPGINQIVKLIQDEGFHAMCLTTRGASLATRTVQQLTTLGIDPSRSAPFKGMVVFLNPHEVLFKNGTLFTSGTHKGKSLFKFLDLIAGDFPLSQIEEVVFINDKSSHLTEVEASCLENGIPFIGLRYGFSDHRVKHFSEEIALYQFEVFGKIINDEEAESSLWISDRS